MGITLYSGSIEIRAKGDGINAASPGDECGENAKPCSGNCVCFIDKMAWMRMEIYSYQEEKSRFLLPLILKINQ